jgi:transcriptional regulator with XRE-family HTH domain
VALHWGHGRRLNPTSGDFSGGASRMSNPIRQRGFLVRGDLLRALRLARDWTQEEAAYRAGLSEKLVRKAESGGRIDATSLAALAALYDLPSEGVGPEDLLAERLDSRGMDFAPMGASVLVAWMMGIWNRRSLDTIDRLAAVDLEYHCELGTLRNAAAVRMRIEGIWQCFNDFQLAIERTAVAGEKVVCRWRLAMTHTGEWHGMEPTGRRICVLGTTSARLEKDKIAECWEFWDPQAAYRELGRHIVADA